MSISLISNKDNTHSDPVKDRSGCYKVGYIIQNFEDDTPCVIPPAEQFLILKVSGVTKAEADAYVEMWQRRIDWEVVNQNLVIDGWRLRVFATEISVSNQGVGAGKITKAMVEAFLNNWNSTIFAFGDNSVTFDIGIYNAIKSQGFWDVNVSQVVFTELSYVQATGVHTVEVDYSASSFTRDQVVHAITMRGGTITNEVGKVITFTITRAQVFKVFKLDIERKVETTLYRRKFYLPLSAVTAIRNAGGYLEVTKTQFLSYIRNKLSE